MLLPRTLRAAAREDEPTMAYDEALAERIRDALSTTEGVVEKKMFGGIAFMVRGNMTCGVVKDDLMARVGRDAHAEALELPGARPMDFTKRPMKGMVFVDGASLDNDEALRGWVERCLAFTSTLPAK